MTQIPSPEELEYQAALAEQAALLDYVWASMPPQMADHAARLCDVKLNISAARVRKAYITLYMTPEYKVTGVPHVRYDLQ
jgi:hypothetical protein